MVVSPVFSQDRSEIAWSMLPPKTFDQKQEKQENLSAIGNPINLVSHF